MECLGCIQAVVLPHVIVSGPCLAINIAVDVDRDLWTCGLSPLRCDAKKKLYTWPRLTSDLYPIRGFSERDA